MNLLRRLGAMPGTMSTATGSRLQLRWFGALPRAMSTSGGSCPQNCVINRGAISRTMCSASGSRRQNVVINREHAGSRVDKFLTGTFDVQHGHLMRLFRQKEVRLLLPRHDAESPSRTSLEPSARLNLGDTVELSPIFGTFKRRKNTATAQGRPVQETDPGASLVITSLEDGRVVGINKPSGMPMQGGTGIRSQHVAGALPSLKSVHRIDKDVSGVVVMAGDRNTAAKLSSWFRNEDPDKKIVKIYLAVVCGWPPEELAKFSRITLPLLKGNERVQVNMQNGKAADTEVMFVRGSKGRRDASIPQAVAVLSPITGRTHQLRVHLNSGLSLPIVGDKKYGFNKRWHSKLHLHALKISFPEVHSRGGGGPRHSVIAPVPEHMHKAMRALLGKTWEKQVVSACQDMEKHVLMRHKVETMEAE